MRCDKANMSQFCPTLYCDETSYCDIKGAEYLPKEVDWISFRLAIQIRWVAFLMKVEIPTEVPCMTLGNTVLFPNAIMPLYIFETRYRQMLADALASSRQFAIAKLSKEPKTKKSIAEEECPCQHITVGVIRLSSLNQDGTSNVLLQGLARARIDRIVQETPYRKIAITPVRSESVESEIDFDKCKNQLSKLVKAKEAFGFNYIDELKLQIDQAQTLDTLTDLAAFSFCAEPEQKQYLLEILNTDERFKALIEILKKDIAMLQLKQNLENDFPGGDIASN